MCLAVIITITIKIEGVKKKKKKRLRMLPNYVSHAHWSTSEFKKQ